MLHMTSAMFLFNSFVSAFDIDRQYEIHTTCLCLLSLRLRSPLAGRTLYVHADSSGHSAIHPPPQGSTIAGTTDSPTEVTHSPSPSEGDIQFILNEVKNYLTPDIEVRRGDVASAWAGIRPLVRDPNNPSDTQNLVCYVVLL